MNLHYPIRHLLDSLQRCFDVTKIILDSFIRLGKNLHLAKLWMKPPNWYISQELHEISIESMNNSYAKQPSLLDRSFSLKSLNALHSDVLLRAIAIFFFFQICFFPVFETQIFRFWYTVCVFFMLSLKLNSVCLSYHNARMLPFGELIQHSQ